MNRYDNIGIKAPKDVNSELRSRFLKSFVISLPFLLIFFTAVLGFVRGCAVAFIAASITAVFSTLISEKAANIIKFIYGERCSKISRREQMAIKLKRATYAKMQKDFKKALNTVNEILEKDPDFYEAKFVKAQILEEGFGMIRKAKRHLSGIIRNTEKDETIHQWARSLYDELCLKADR